MMAHALTEVQKAEKLFSMPALGARRPSDLLAAMFEFCPAGEEDGSLFRALFLTRLPAELRVHLEAQETASLKALALRADQLWQTLAAKQAVLAAQFSEMDMADQEEETLAAIKQKFFQKKGKKAAGGEKAKGQQDGGGGSQADGKQKANRSTVTIQLCWRHAKYGAAAYRCADTDNCQHQGN
jgi:hypothetical protein